MVASFYLADEAAMLAFGAEMAHWLNPGMLVFLEGELGAGKTTLTRGILRGFGYNDNVKSPTYTLVESYQLADFTLYHFDLYRLSDPEELEYAGMRDYLDSNALVLIEWPQRGQGYLPAPDLRIRIYPEPTGRRLKLSVDSDQALLIINKLNNKFSLLD